MEGFKKIFYVEWLHRNIGRSIGVLFFVPGTIFYGLGMLGPKTKVFLKVMALAGIT